MDPDQILWVAPFPPYLQTIFLLFQNCQVSKFYEFVSFSLTWAPWEQKFQNATPPIFTRSEPNFMMKKVEMRE